MNATHTKWILLLVSVLALGLVLQPQPAYARPWPPFYWDLTPTYADGKITYKIRISRPGTQRISDIIMKVPLPEGTRYVEGGSPHPGVDVSFDGQEVTIFAPIFTVQIQDVRFVVEVTDTKRTVFTTHAWFKWEGDFPGDYLTKDVSIDMTRPRLNWSWPFFSLAMPVNALVEGDTITYSIYPKNVGWLRMWDMRIDLPYPPGTTFVSSQAPKNFTGGPGNGMASFLTLELPDVDNEPIRVKLATTDVLTGALLATRVSAFWKNEGWGVGTDYPAEEGLVTGDLVVEARAPQLAVADFINDVPLAYTDLASVAFLPEKHALKVAFYTKNDFLTPDDAVEFSIYLFADCGANLDTIDWAAPEGTFRAGYEHTTSYSYFEYWNKKIKWWSPVEGFEEITGTKPAGQNAVYLWVPLDPLPKGVPLCWQAQSATWNYKKYDPYPYGDDIVFTQDTKLDLPQLGGARQ